MPDINAAREQDDLSNIWVEAIGDENLPGVSGHQGHKRREGASRVYEQRGDHQHARDKAERKRPEAEEYNASLPKLEFANRHHIYIYETKEMREILD